ncbi:MAG: hypothetical protein GKC10_03420, partial [Methanosarcinales archaeon]|nr:hypothetical protein [Methanosarcinales archaeon]
MMNQPTLTLSVRQEGGPGRRTFSFDLIFEDRILASDSLNAVLSLEVGEMARQHSTLLAEPTGREETAGYLALLGESMFRLWFRKAWEDAGDLISRAGSLLVASEAEEVLALPWESVRLPGREGGAPTWQVRRRPLAGAGMPRSAAPLSGPLRI